MAETNTIRKQVTVGAPIEKAFRVFTEGFDGWWPRGHHIGKSGMKQAVMEQKPGGRWYEIGDDGSTCEWGKVLAWEPPTRLVLAWQITSQWAYDPNFVTEVEVTFAPLGTSETLVTLEHKHMDRFGDGWQTHFASMDSEGGWGRLLKIFAADAEGDLDTKMAILKELEMPEV